MVLGLSYQTILGMGNGDDFLNKIVAAWIKRQDSVLSQSGEPTWIVLADKLEEIGHVEIATGVRRKHMHDGPQHEGESEQQDGNPSILSTDASNSLMDNQLNSTSLLPDTPSSCSSDLTIAPISILQPVTQSTQDQPHNIIGYVTESYLIVIQKQVTFTIMGKGRLLDLKALGEQGGQSPLHF